jgi:hypothetical protein
LKFKIHISFYGDNTRTGAFREMKFGTVKDHGHAFKVYLNRFLFDNDFKYGNGANIEVMLGQTLKHSV